MKGEGVGELEGPIKNICRMFGLTRMARERLTYLIQRLQRGDQIKLSNSGNNNGGGSNSGSNNDNTNSGGGSNSGNNSNGYNNGICSGG